jgi:hypothetical protein
MEKSSKRGKIPQADWPLIMARYDAGETLASIARTYDCSPPAISYIVSRSRDKSANETPPAAAAEAQLIKSQPNGASVAIAEPPVVSAELAIAEPRSAPPIAATAPQADARVPHSNGGGAQAQMPRATYQPTLAPRPPNNEPRPKLHLGFGANGHSNGNGNGNGATPAAAADRQVQPAVSQPGLGPLPTRAAGPIENGHNGSGSSASFGSRPPAQAPRGEGEGLARKDGNALDQELRSRVDGDITAFLAAFDAVLAADTQESRFGLREATDRLLRAGARTRIELERLEARVPLTPRDGGRQSEPAWRYR